MKNTIKAPVPFVEGQTVRAVSSHNGGIIGTTVVFVGKKHVMVEWQDFSCKQARFNFRPATGMWENTYLSRFLKASSNKNSAPFDAYVCAIEAEFAKLGYSGHLNHAERANVAAAFKQGIAAGTLAASLIKANAMYGGGAAQPGDEIAYDPINGTP